MISKVSLFKNKQERTARLPKGSSDPKAKKFSLADFTVKSVKEEETSEKSKDLKPSAPKVVASGDVRIDASFQSEVSLQGGLKEEKCDSEAGSSNIKLKLKVGDTKFYQLKPRTKPDELNEELIFTRNLRRAVKFNDELKKQFLAKRVKKDSKNPCFGSISKSEGKWSFDTPAPEELIEIHRKNFNLEEDSWDNDNDGPKLFRRPNGTIMDWDYFLTSDPMNLASVPPVTCFKWAPFADIWSEIAKPGLCIELRNPFIPGDEDIHWVGTTVHFAGYRALVKFETFDFQPAIPYVAWMSFCSNIPKPLGWCKKNSKALNPGPIIQGMGDNQIEERLEKISARPTISPEHCTRLSKQIQKLQECWKPAVPVEAMDVHSLHRNRLARITAVVGDRVHISFYSTKDDEDDYSDGYWFHCQSEGLHPLFWSQTVGMVLNGISQNTGTPDIKLPSETFCTWPADKIVINEGMRLEALHPFLTNKIVGAVVVKILNHGYFEIQTREVNTFSRLHFVYHVTSPYVLPWGFGAKHGIEVDFENDGDEDEDDPDEFLNLSALSARPEHKFEVGDKLEAFEFINPSFIGPATIQKTAGHLLLLHFDNWKDIGRNYQWVDAQSTEIYPIGYSQLLGLKWQSGT